MTVVTKHCMHVTRWINSLLFTEEQKPIYLEGTYTRKQQNKLLSYKGESRLNGLRDQIRQMWEHRRRSLLSNVHKS